jgi:predicted RNase H-like HicB family nuclease
MHIPSFLHNVSILLEESFQLPPYNSVMAHREFTAVFFPEEGGWVGVVEEVPGAHTQGDTLDEARENLKEALEMVLQHRRETVAEEIDTSKIVRERLLLDAS